MDVMTFSTGRTRRYRRWLTATVVFLIVGSQSVTAQTYRYSLGLGYGFQRAVGGDFFDFDTDYGVTAHAAMRILPRWEVEFEGAWFRLENNTLADSVVTLDGFANNAAVDLRTVRLGVTLNRLLLPEDSRFNVAVGTGGGLMIWDILDHDADTAYNVTGQRGEQTDFSASELFFRGLASVRVKLSPHISFDLNGRADYLSGAGAEFAQAVAGARDRWLIGSSASLTIHFGSAPTRLTWEERLGLEPAASPGGAPVLRGPDSDSDGIPDLTDRCDGTPIGVTVDQFGCPLDSDGDGVYDGLDDCPETPPPAVRTVDIHGCAVDADFDGVPDYRDACPHNPVGAIVDSNGCPLDGDGDGVPDGLDDCPNTLVGVAVDKRGCIDLSMLDTPMVLNIAYLPGSFEIDPHNRERLKRLAGLLSFVPDIKLEIYGYTDDIGTARANLKLSEKRARRVRDFLVANGVAAERITVHGRGESNFVASNRTAEGRAKNRRIEIVFHR